MSAEQPALPLASVTFLIGPLAGQTFQITKPMTTIGRDFTNDLVIKDDRMVSRQHAQLRCEAGVWTIENCSQGNTLTVNGMPVKQGPVADQAIIGLGGETTFRLDIHPLADDPLDETRPAPVRHVMRAASEADVSHAAATDQVASPTVAPVQAMPHEGEIPSPQVTLTAPAAPEDSAPAQLPDTAELEGPTGLMSRKSQTLVGVATQMGIPTLEVSSNTGAPRRTYPLDKPAITLGRSATNDIVIADPSISAQHVQLVREGHQFFLIHPPPKHEQTTNGLLYQGRKIRGDEFFRRKLEPGDVFRVGDERGTLITFTYHDGSGLQQEALPEMRPIRLGEAQLTIGRKADNTIVLAHPLVSGHHAQLVREGGAYRILDLHSTNHIYVNGQLVTNHLLKLGDEIRIGPYRLIYEGTQITQYDESKAIRIDALHLKKYAARQTTLLNNISLSIPPRAFVALVGGSGAGKSTLMDALSGLRPAQEGQVLYNGQDYYRNLAAFNTQIGYVPQEDIVHRDLTVERALYYAAKIRLPGDFTEEQIWQRISEVLEDVELTERRTLLIKRLSGGQRKRVSIALELLANPSLFFLDEPTSGLDPGLDRKMMVLLRKLADKGHTVILVTHATNNISVCDYVCFLASGGRLAYFGTPDGAKAYFEQTEFAEIYSALDSTEGNPNVPEEAEARFKLSPAYQEYIAQPLRETSGAMAKPLPPKEIRRARRGNPWKQLLLLSLRRLELLKNDVPTLLILLLQAPLVAVLLMVLIRFGLGANILDGNNVVQCLPQIRTPSGQVLVIPGTPSQGQAITCNRVQTYLQTNPQGVQYAQARGGVQEALQDFEVAGHNGDAQRLVFMLGLIPVLFGCIGGIFEIIKEEAIYRRERTVSLGILPYMFSKILVFGGLAVAQMASVVLIVNLFEPLPQGVLLPGLLEGFITLALTGVAGMLLGFVASAWAPNQDAASNLLTLLIVPQVIFSGVIVPLKVPVAQIVAFIFPLRWAMSALGSSLGLHSDLVGGDRFFGDGNNYFYHPALYSVYTNDEATQRVLLCWLALGLMIVVMICLIGLALKRKDARR